MSCSEQFDLESEFLVDVYEKYPICLVRGEGAKVWDKDGKTYLDFGGGYGVAILGHGNPEVVRAIKEQAERLVICHGSLYSEARANFLKKLSSVMPLGLTKFFLSNSGAEAVECAIKVLRKYTGKTEIIAMKGSYHGKTMGALSLTWNRKYRKNFEPLMQGVTFCEFGNITEIKKAITEETAGVIVEPVQGESGVHLPPEGFLRELREICDEKGVLLVFDEIQTGLGRTGRFWASQHWNVTPDLMCIGKGIAGGTPMGVTAGRADVMSSLSRGEHTSTFGGNPLACAAATATIEYMLRERLPERAARVGEYLKERLLELAEDHRMIREVRGLGLMVAAECRFPINDILMRALERGVIFLYSGRNVLRFLPPLIITEKDVEEAVSLLNSVLEELERIKPVAR